MDHPLRPKLPERSHSVSSVKFALGPAARIAPQMILDREDPPPPILWVPLDENALPTEAVTVEIVPMTVAHSGAVLAIYQAGIDEGNATFETKVPDWEGFTAARLPGHRFVAVSGNDVLGWVAVSPVSGRAVYRGVVEHSVYVDPGARGQGVGRRLLDALIDSTEAAGIWTIQSGIFPENAASVALHAAAGFRVVGVRERLGQHYGRWRDVVLLERRSRVV
jgi:L-amino acid N-acyltransferase YncA